MPKHTATAAPEIQAGENNALPDLENTPQDLQNFLSQNCPDAAYTCKVYLLRQNIKGGHKPERQVIDEYFNTFPSIRDLGMENGAGTYEYFFYIQKKGGGQDVKSFRVNLAPRWDILRDENLQSRGINPAARPDNIQSSLTVMKDMIQVITPLLQAQGSGNGNNPAAVLNTMIEMQGRMLNQNFSAQMEMQNKAISSIEESRKKLLYESDGGGDDNALISEIISTLKGFLPLLMVSPAKQAAAVTGQAIRSRPDVKALIDSAGRRAALESKIKSEFDPKTADKVLTILGGVSGGNGRRPVAAQAQARPRTKAPAAARK